MVSLTKERHWKYYTLGASQDNSNAFCYFMDLAVDTQGFVCSPIGHGSASWSAPALLRSQWEVFEGLCLSVKQEHCIINKY